jgi:hypothetical protein
MGQAEKSLHLVPTSTRGVVAMGYFWDGDKINSNLSVDGDTATAHDTHPIPSTTDLLELLQEQVFPLVHALQVGPAERERNRGTVFA